MKDYPPLSAKEEREDGDYRGSSEPDTALIFHIKS
jgi:hypothetical protein